MITIAIRAMWDAARLILLAVIGGLSLAVWALLALAVVTGNLTGGF